MAEARSEASKDKKKKESASEFNARDHLLTAPIRGSVECVPGPLDKEDCVSRVKALERDGTQKTVKKYVVLGQHIHKAYILCKVGRRHQS